MRHHWLAPRRRPLRAAERVKNGVRNVRDFWGILGLQLLGWDFVEGGWWIADRGSALGFL
eukprot:7424739-Pyramimonas_sp.AAC.1